MDISGKNYLSAFAEYKAFLGEKFDNNEYPFTLNVGYNGYFDKRSTSYRFIFGGLGQNTGNNSAVVNIDKPQAIFNQKIEQGIYSYYEGSTSQYKNNIYQFVNAGFISIDYKPDQSWNILLGGRVENNMNVIRYKQLSTGINDKFINITQNKYYILPSLSVKRHWITNLTSDLRQVKR